MTSLALSLALLPLSSLSGTSAKVEEYIHILFVDLSNALTILSGTIVGCASRLTSPGCLLLDDGMI